MKSASRKVKSIFKSVEQNQQDAFHRNFRLQVRKRLELIELLINKEFFFKINDEVIKNLSTTLQMSVEDVTKILSKYKKMRLIIPADKDKLKDTYKIANSCLTEEQLSKQWSYCYHYKKYGRT